jgi:hypothetical protein
MNTSATVAGSHHEKYQCRVERTDDGAVLAVSVEAESDAGSRSYRVNSNKATRIAGPVHDILRAGGVGGRAWASTKTIPVDYLVGAQLELLLVAVKPLRRADRIDHVAEGIAEMSVEEASYWHAKLRRPGGLRALRILLGTGRSR